MGRSKKNKGEEPVFPSSPTDWDGGNRGLAFRDYVAVSAFSALIAGLGDASFTKDGLRSAARLALRASDMCLEERGRRGENGGEAD
jgi:hypothetical protein